MISTTLLINSESISANPIIKFTDRGLKNCGPLAVEQMGRYASPSAFPRVNFDLTDGLAPSYITICIWESFRGNNPQTIYDLNSESLIEAIRARPGHIYVIYGSNSDCGAHFMNARTNSRGTIF